MLPTLFSTRISFVHNSIQMYTVRRTDRIARVSQNIGKRESFCQFRLLKEKSPVILDGFYEKIVSVYFIVIVRRS